MTSPITFVWAQYLWCLLLIPLLVFVFWLSARRRKQSAQSFADEHLLTDLIQTPRARSRRLLSFLQLFALSALLLAAARPVATAPLPVNKAAVVIALDASRSMLAEDLDPNRLEVARDLAKQFIESAPPTTQIGLVSFSDAASVLVTPTTDKLLLLEALDRVEAAQNTSLTAAIVTAVKMLPGRKDVRSPDELEPPGFASPDNEDLIDKATDPPPGSVLILSDGVTNVSSNPDLPPQFALDTVARFASDNEVKLYTLALGEDGGTVTRIDGHDYFIPFEEDNLERLADKSDGQVLNPEDAELSTVFRDLGNIIQWERSSMEVSFLLSGLAVLFMGLAAFLSLRLQRRVP